MGVKVLNKLGIDVAASDFQCGCDYFGTDERRIKALAEENGKLLSDYDTVIVGCARCYHVFKKYYDIKVKHISQIIDKKLRSWNHDLKGSGDVFYHDPCYLARFEKVMEEPREVLRILGYTVREFKNNRERTDCCGDYSNVRALRSRAAELRLEQLPANSTVTAACPKCTQNFSSFNKPNSKITVKPFLELVDSALNVDIADVY
jgi:Fe-S oxidoreductase